MLNLMKLELKKNKIRGNILGGFIATFLIMFFVIVLNYDNTEELPFSDYDSIFAFINTFTSITFTIFASVLLAKYIIDEYKSGSITVLFMYPLERKKLLLAKIAVVFLFTFLFGIISRVVIFAGFYWYNQYAHFIPGTLGTELLLQQGVGVLVNSVMVSCISLASLYFGMRKHSVPATIVSAIIIGVILNSTSGTNGFTLNSIIIIPATFAVIGILVAYLAIRNVEVKDVM
ncbi:ABC transporter permease [Paenibacillus sp. FSL R5-0407]|uniref:ABC transporter permease n=1 Tax=Paenibacillus TaxID=44249 RepID=UPI0025B6E4C8|nr:ABC transporter permease [Paenibacillus vini]MDN4068931.1 ABC transporter permease [Paenibacillus vini]